MGAFDCFFVGELDGLVVGFLVGDVVGEFEKGFLVGDLVGDDPFGVALGFPGVGFAVVGEGVTLYDPSIKAYPVVQPHRP